MRNCILFLFMAFTINCSAADVKTQKKGHTIVLNDKLPAPKQKFRVQSADHIVRDIEYRNSLQAIAYSFTNDQLCSFGQDNFFKCMVKAYGDHRSVVLSPDIIWTLIAQGFSRHVNQHSEKLRDRIVYHKDGKVNLTVKSGKDLYSPDMEWDKVLNDFDAQIADNTKNNLANVMRANFSTTDQTSRIVSQMTLMTSVKAYFKYTGIYVGCGIPSITIEGTTDDWVKVLEKTMQLRRYGLKWWVDDLIPILTQFIEASKGHVDKQFWNSIVKDNPVSKLEGGGCSPDKPTKLDGWFLKLMPFYTDEGKRTPREVSYDVNMPTQLLSADFTYQYIDEKGNETNHPMKMLCGFVGVEIDSATQAMRPKLAWMVCEKDNKKELEKFINSAPVVDTIPEVLQNVDYQPSINMTITNPKAIIPDWLGKLKIDQIQIAIKGSDRLENRLREMFPDRIITSKKAYVGIKQCDTEYTIQTKKSFEPDNYLYSVGQVCNSLDYDFAKFPVDTDATMEPSIAKEEFIEQNRRIPQTNKKLDEQKEVKIELTVEIDGTISHYEITDTYHSPTQEMKDEALRLASLLPKYTPAMVTNIEGEPKHKVRSKCVFIVSF